MLIFVRLLGGGPSTLTITGTALRNGNLDIIFDRSPVCGTSFTTRMLLTFFPLLEVATTEAECFFEVLVLSISKEAPDVPTTGVLHTAERRATLIT